MTQLQVRALAEDERGWLRELLTERWGAPIAVGRGRVWDAAGLPALVVEQDQERFGVATYDAEPHGDVVELVTIDALREGAGVGRALVEAVAAEAAALGARTLRVMTTNDNLRALRLYQRLGFVIGEVRVGEVAAARRIKPSIPMEGRDGIPIRDEIDLVMELTHAQMRG